MPLSFWTGHSDTEVQTAFGLPASCRQSHLVIILIYRASLINFPIKSHGPKCSSGVTCTMHNAVKPIHIHKLCLKHVIQALRKPWDDLMIYPEGHQRHLQSSPQGMCRYSMEHTYNEHPEYPYLSNFKYHHQWIPASNRTVTGRWDRLSISII